VLIKERMLREMSPNSLPVFFSSEIAIDLYFTFVAFKFCL